MKRDKVSEMGKRARQFTIDNYSVESVGKKLEEILDNMNKIESIGGIN